MVRLVPMSPGDFDSFLERLLTGYADENVRSGRWTKQESLAKAREETGKLLPAGRETPNHYFFTIVAGPADEKVGAVWLAIEPRGGFIYDLVVFEPYRRRGYAEAAMRLTEQVAREKGAARIGLHVFADNRAARNLYGKLGYSETDVIMYKPLVP